MGKVVLGKSVGKGAIVYTLTVPYDVQKGNVKSSALDDNDLSTLLEIVRDEIRARATPIEKARLEEHEARKDAIANAERDKYLAERLR